MRILVFQHLSVEHPGTFTALWRADGHDIATVELDQGETIPPLEGYDLLAVMGGPMDVWQEADLPWLVAEKAAIRRFVVALGRPYLGICLGHQLLADALGGRVGLMAASEVGLAEVTLTEAGQADPLFSGFPQRFETFQWHSAEVQALPDGAVRLAANGAASVQALRYGRHAWGLQYHVEITPQTVPEWRTVPAYAASLEATMGSETACRLEAAVAGRLPAFEASAKRLNENLFAVITRA